MSDALEVLGYFAGFWLFVFSVKFREAVYQDWRDSGFLGKVFIVGGGLLSTVIGIAIPVLLIALIVSYIR